MPFEITQDITGAGLRLSAATRDPLPPCGGGMGWGLVQYGTALPHLTTPTPIPAPQGGGEEFAAPANPDSSTRSTELPPALELTGVAKTFTMHLQGGLRMPLLDGVAFSVAAGECCVLSGPSGIGKSSILKMIFGSYRCDRGAIVVRDGGRATDVVTAAPRQVLALRRRAIGYVSQFLRAVPRVAAIDIVAEPALAAAGNRAAAREAAAALLRRLNIPERLWDLPPATFSGGEQQRINIARGFLPDLPVLLLDEPTASLDAANKAAVVDLIAEKKKRGVAILAVVHDDDVRAAVADRLIDVAPFSKVA
jgi:alpha-D-ribose 1-methylphosphonate 5-triphosphate synthase subunit PhnL